METDVLEEANFFELDEVNAIHVIHHPPGSSGQTFVFHNSMGSTTDSWELTIAPSLRSLGYGTLTFDYRGQGRSRYGADALLQPNEIVRDTTQLLRAFDPVRPVLVGLSIGGLFAMRSILGGANAEGLVLVNTLRKPSARVEWINTLEERLIEIGGMQLVHDVLRPMLNSNERLESIRPDHLREGGYTPWPSDNPRRRLAAGAKLADWDVPYHRILAPVLVISGRHDRLFRVEEDVDELVSKIPNARQLVYDDGGHGLHVEFADRFVSDLADFASSLSTGAVATR